MLQLVKTFANYYYPKNFERVDEAKKLKNLNWTNTVIGGSHALREFTGDSKWDSHDIDIFISARDKEEFEREVNNFMRSNRANLLMNNQFQNGTRENPKEEFHDRIKGTCTFMVPEISKPVQLIYLNGWDGRTAQSILNETTDIPSCINYTIENGERTFHIPEKCRKALFTREVGKEQSCESRIQKYTGRGYRFL